MYNQFGKAMDASPSLAEIMVRGLTSRFKFYFIANSVNKVLVNEMKGRELPKRTAYGAVLAH